MIVGIVLQFESVNDEYYTCDFKICADGAGQHLSLHPNIVIGDLDSFKFLSEATVVEQENKFGGLTRRIDDTLIIHNPCQDTTDFQKCLDYIQGLSDVTEIRIFGGLSGRFDHTISVLHTLQKYSTNSPVILHNKSNTLFVLDKGIHNMLLSDFENCSVGLFAITPTHVKTSGLVWDMDAEIQLGDFISSSNKLKSNGTIDCKGKCFLVRSRLQL